MNRIHFLAALLLCSGCSTIKGTKLWAPEWFDMEPIATRVFVDKEMPAAQRKRALELVAESEQRLARHYGDVASTPKLFFCSTEAIANKEITDFDGRKLEHASAGEGQPLIVFISGGGPADMDSWGKVYPEARSISKVFAYNRFGDGHSDQVAEAQTGAKVVATLRELLQRSGFTPPYVLVGHSLGGLYANLFARLHPREVAGIVLVDSSHPDQGEMMRNPGMIWGVINGAIQKLYATINPTKFSEIAVFDETASQVKNAGPFPDVPLAVITAGKRFTLLASDKMIQTVDDHQRDLAAMSPQGQQIIAERSGHFVQNDQPEVVIRAILEVVEQTRLR